MNELFRIDQWVYMIWTAAGLTIILLVAGARAIAASAASGGRFANLVEALVDFARENIAEAFLGEHAKKWFTFSGNCRDRCMVWRRTEWSKTRIFFWKRPQATLT
jgi:F0F1-type ATP synthase membrane subunit a